MSDLATMTAKKQVEKSSQENKSVPNIRDLIRAQQPAIEAQLAGALNSGSFIRAALSTISGDESLQQATPQSVLGSIMLAAQLKLEIGPALGHFYLTPRQESYQDGDGGWYKRWMCLPIIGYQGLIELAYRTGRIEKIETFLVRHGDTFSYGANSERGRYFDWTPADHDETRAWTGAIATAKILGAGTIWAFLPKDKILARRPKGWEKGPWKSNEEEMARKTLVREIAPYLPKSTEIALAVQRSREVEEEGRTIESITGIPELVVSSSETFTPNYIEVSPEESAKEISKRLRNE